VAEGDMVVVPAGVVHGFTSVEQPLTYMVVRIDPAKVLPLK
jgi:mannose-6-phosphate isomerase-like protein (cupin superfamily)